MISNQQTPQEWLWFLDQVGPLASVLEIGSYDGMSLMAFATSGSLTSGAIVRSIDLGDHGTAPALQEICKRMVAGGIDAQCFIGDSHAAAAQQWARQWATYDLVFIDGDHGYDGVKQDFAAYAPMGRIVALHDVGGHEVGCVQFWQEVKAKNEMRTLEYTAHPRYQIISLGQQGIGLLFRAHPLAAATVAAQ